MAPILIEYQAKLSWTDHQTLKYHHRELCDIKHEIDPETLQTIQFDFEPVKEDKPCTGGVTEGPYGGEIKRGRGTDSGMGGY